MAHESEILRLRRTIRISLGVFIVGLGCDAIRGIPLPWRLIDCSFGVAGLIPLWMAQRSARRLQALGAVTSP